FHLCEKLPELAGIELKGRSVVIGAMTRHVDVANSAVVKEHIPALAYMAGLIGDPVAEVWAPGDETDKTEMRDGNDRVCGESHVDGLEGQGGVDRIDAVRRIAVVRVGNLRPQNPVPRQVFDIAQYRIRARLEQHLALLDEGLSHTEFQAFVQQRRTRELEREVGCAFGRANEFAGHRLGGTGPDRVQIGALEDGRPIDVAT
ncbi:hypothetical protein B4Q13_21085, partial [Lacticaseibacillus rhamnosus]